MTEDDLRKMGLVKDDNGDYRKAKTVKQPREKYLPMTDCKVPTSLSFSRKTHKVTGSAMADVKLDKDGYFRVVQFRTIKLTLFGEPMPKQSVRANKDGHFYQPQKQVDRKKDYQKQIMEQLPVGFRMFTTEVHITKFHCIFQPLKKFHKIKGRMDALRNGEIFYKNTKPDLIDNLKKLVFDSMSGIVCKDDSIIVTENDTAKYYGMGGCVIITLKGY